jgi:hypothetical protein
MPTQAISVFSSSQKTRPYSSMTSTTGASIGSSTPNRARNGSPSRPNRPDGPRSNSDRRCFHIACIVP